MYLKNLSYMSCMLDRFDFFSYDMDLSCLAKGEVTTGISWVDAMHVAGLVREEKQLFDKYYGDQERYGEWLCAIGENFRGMRAAQIEREVLKRVVMRNGLEKFVQGVYEGRLGMRQGILSAGVDFVSNYLMEKMNMDFAVSNELVIGEDGLYTGEVIVRVTETNKPEVAANLFEQYGVTALRAGHFGDSHSDHTMWAYVQGGFGLDVHEDHLEHIDENFACFDAAGEYFGLEGNKNLNSSVK